MFDELEIDEVRRRDKRVAAVHEASHAFVGRVIGLSIESVELSMNPNGALAEKHWVGSTIWRNHFASCMDELPPDLAKRETMKLRLFSLAGYAGECMFNPHLAEPPPEADEILEWLMNDWETLSESDRRPFAGHRGSVTEREVGAVLHLLGEGREILLDIADRLEEWEALDRDTLDELLRYMVIIPDGPDLLDFGSWEIRKW
jgi:hypothetical protein